MTLINEITTTLGETEPEPLSMIHRAVTVLGEERATAILAETRQIEANGGMLTEDGKRRRSAGGCFFKLVKSHTSSRERWLIFNSQCTLKPTSKTIPVTWRDIPLLASPLLTAEKGALSTVKLTLVGQPGRIIEKEDVVLTSMETTSTAPSLPKGIPQPPSQSMTYLVFIAMKQWAKVRDALNQNPADPLIIEGFPVFDDRIGKQGTMCLYAQSVTTKQLQQAMRKAQKAAVQG